MITRFYPLCTTSQGCSQRNSVLDCKILRPFSITMMPIGPCQFGVRQMEAHVRRAIGLAIGYLSRYFSQELLQVPQGLESPRNHEPFSRPISRPIYCVWLQQHRDGTILARSPCDPRILTRFLGKHYCKGRTCQDVAPCCFIDVQGLQFCGRGAVSRRCVSWA